MMLPPLLPKTILAQKSVLERGYITENIGDPGWIRTSDPQLRRLVLYPAELRGRVYSEQDRARAAIRRQKSRYRSSAG